jgi:predicted dehydrogenase
MGSSHARAYHKMAEFKIVGLVDRNRQASASLSAELGGLPQFEDFEQALEETNPGAVSISTYPDSHAFYAMAAMRRGCHVFVEKPLAETVEDAQAVTDLAKSINRKVLVGYILRVHPAWQKFIELARTLGKPLVMRMNLNQQTSGGAWLWLKHLMESMSPLVDCGVHYVDIMCQMTGAKPVSVHAIGARLTGELIPGMYNYGQLQITYDDGSVGWFEAGWGPMISEEAFFIKDVIGPLGCVSIVTAAGPGTSSNLEAHTRTNRLRLHHAQLDNEGRYAVPDEIFEMADEPNPQQLCDREQAYFLRAIQEDLDLGDHLRDAVNSLRIVLAADQSFRRGEVVHL